MLHAALGKGYQERGFKVVGRETRHNFQKYSFQARIDLVTTDLEKHFWHEDAGGSFVFVGHSALY